METIEALRLFLTAFVPLRIIELRQQGGPTDGDIARAQDYLPDLGENGDALIYRREGVTGRIAGEVLDALAVLAFCPGGVKLFALHFEASP